MRIKSTTIAHVQPLPLSGSLCLAKIAYVLYRTYAFLRANAIPSHSFDPLCVCVFQQVLERSRTVELCVCKHTHREIERDKEVKKWKGKRREMRMEIGRSEWMNEYIGTKTRNKSFRRIHVRCKHITIYSFKPNWR